MRRIAQRPSLRYNFPCPLWILVTDSRDIAPRRSIEGDGVPGPCRPGGGHAGGGDMVERNLHGDRAGRTALCPA